MTTARSAPTSDFIGPTSLYIGGDWQPSGDGGRFDVTDPASDRVIAAVASATPDDARRAVEAASEALPGWAATPPRERGELLRRAFDLMLARTEDLARLVSAENGKALADSRAEIAYAAEFLRWYSEEAMRVLGTVQTAPSGTNRILVVRKPIGVSVLVTPWNFPAAMATRKIGPALAAGCTVVLKPASDTPLTALALGRILEEAGAPPGVVNVLPSRRSGPVVSAMLEMPQVRKLSFTDSTDVGQTLLRTAADHVLSCSMELGGNAPFLVLADADVSAAVDGAMVAKMRNGGEACTAANRFLVHESVADEFVAGLAARMEALTLGPGTDPATELGPLITASACSEVHGLVESAVRDRAHLVTGGRPVEGPGHLYPPTVLDHVPHDASILDYEIFGPVAPVVRFSTLDDAVALANSTPFGLAAYVFTSDVAQGLRLAGRLEAGMVGVNRGALSDPAAPFGGVKKSGLGREGGHEGLLEYTEEQYVAVEW